MANPKRTDLVMKPALAILTVDERRHLELNLYEKGHTQSDIADLVGVKQPTVAHDLKLMRKANATSRVAIAEANEIIKNHRARFATADALLHDLEEASRK